MPKVSGKRIKTMNVPPYGRLNVRDAKQGEEVSYVLTPDSARKGVKHRPSGCAIALDNKVHADLFPGEFLGSYVYKTNTIAVVKINNKLQVIRWAHTNSQRKAINGFDNSTVHALKAGDLVRLLVPEGYMRLGGSNSGGTGDPKKVKKRREAGSCRKRGVFVDQFHTAQAAKETRGTERTVIS